MFGEVMAMTKSQANKKVAVDVKLLTLPDDAGGLLWKTGLSSLAHCWERVDLSSFVASEACQLIESVCGDQDTVRRDGFFRTVGPGHHPGISVDFWSAWQ